MSKKKILIVDDEEIVRQSVRLTLEDERYEIHEAENGDQALEKADRIKPDLVILDLMMPDKWGYRVCEQLKNNPDTKGCQVIILTGKGSGPSKALGELKGGDDFVTKPFEPGELREKVGRMLDLE